VATREKRIFPRHTTNTPIRAPPNDVPRTANEEAKHLGQDILPAFKARLYFPLVMNPSNFKKNARSWFEAVMNLLIEFDQILEAIDSSIMMIWRTWKPYQDYKLSIHNLTLFKVQKIDSIQSTVPCQKDLAHFVGV
jgi:hypothetical protein